jgi:Secretion system C-terminal sorting domain
MKSSSIIPNKPLSIKIYNLLGKLIISTTASASSNMTFDIASLKEGIYMIVLAQNNEVMFTKKFFKN